VLFGIQNEREWTQFCSDVLNDATIATDARFITNSSRVANRGALTQAIESAFTSRTSAQVVADLDRAGIANGRVNDVGAAQRHEQLAARERWRSVGSPVGALDASLPPANLSEVEPYMADVPELGAHTDALLSELGFSTDRIATLRAAGVV
jgi:itaconate CoA-transferase